MFSRFQKEKSDFLGKKDKSKKGSIDKDIKEIVKLINSKSDYCSTSSCAGRIVLLEMKSKRKDECNWLITKHSKIKFNEIKNTLKKYQNKKIRHQVWFKQQPLILHVACRYLNSAKKLLESARMVFKRTGVISITNKKLVIEIIGDERVETIIADENFIINDEYLKNLIKYANSNFEENKRKSEKFLRIIKFL